MNTAIKLCGLNDLESVRAAAACRADAVGFVFYPPSPRAVDLTQVMGFQSVLPPFVTRVGLVVDPDVAFVQGLIESRCLDVIQFHGRETGHFCEQFRFPYLKALPAHPEVARADYWIKKQAEYPNAKAFLLDTPDTGLKGGTGQTFDWQHWPASAPKPLILSGGLTFDNVVQAISATRPYAVDLSSGIESQRGQKCQKKMAAFVAKVRSIDG
jgi:phosphoribosylanthranilate isomerase